jgi:hypothetical protein
MARKYEFRGARKARERQYRGIFATVEGKWIGLDFYGENLTFARMHAEQVARDTAMHAEHGPLTLVRVTPVDDDEFRAGQAGSWFPVN